MTQTHNIIAGLEEPVDYLPKQIMTCYFTYRKRKWASYHNRKTGRVFLVCRQPNRPGQTKAVLYLDSSCRDWLIRHDGKETKIKLKSRENVARQICDKMIDMI